MFWVIEDIVYGPVLHYFPGIHYGNVVAGFSNNSQIVCDQDHSGTKFPL